MLKAIFAKDIEVGDVILPYEGATPVTVESVDKYDNPRHVTIHPVTCTGCFKLGTGTIVALLRRPRPKGKTESQALEAVIDRAGAVIQSVSSENIGRPRSVERRIEELRDALDAYELGKSPDRARSVHAVHAANLIDESDIDGRH